MCWQSVLKVRRRAETRPERRRVRPAQGATREHTGRLERVSVWTGPVSGRKNKTPGLTESALCFGSHWAVVVSSRLRSAVPWRSCLGTTFAIVLRGTAQEEEAAEVAPAAAEDPTSQPIAFSHQHHVGELEFDCQLCHAYARRGPVAGIPSVARCVGCHRVVQVERPEIKKILQYWEDAEPIPWVRVHSLPDHVRFTHKRHVRAGVSCQSCHGDVAQMDAAQQVEPLTMGWCPVLP